jgi:hypothetical protein
MGIARDIGHETLAVDDRRARGGLGPSFGAGVNRTLSRP